MKLVNLLITRFSIVIMLILAVWSGIYFFLQMKEINDGVDEGLMNLKQEFILKANKDAAFVRDLKEHNPLNIIINEISYEDAIGFVETLSTTQVYFPTEMEYEQVRMLTSAFFCEPDNHYYQLQFFTSTVESDDLIKNMFYLLVALWVSLCLSIVIVGKIIINRSNKPFYQLLDKLKKFRLGKDHMIDFPETKITEYKELNESVEDLLQRSIEAYTDQKVFIENASHEMQTPLSVIAGKLELLLNEESLTREQLEEISSILSILNKLKKLNTNLLLLSKIRNNQYSQDAPVDMRVVFHEVIRDLEDIAGYKGITIEEAGDFSPVAAMNTDLAYILANNLMKNSITHNVRKGKVSVTYDKDEIIITNDGKPLEDNINIFDRYATAASNKGSSGLGLSIVKSITDLYGFKIDYSYSGSQHVFILHLKKI